MNATTETPKPKIFLFINRGAGTDWVVTMAMAEDGTVIGGHISSSDSFARADIGCAPGGTEEVPLVSDIGMSKHATFQKHYPDGYDCEWVDNVKGHGGLMAAYALNQERRVAAEVQS